MKKIKLQYLLPKKFLTKIIGWLSKKKMRWITTMVIKIFIKYYNINMKEAERKNASEYNSFNDFFTRSLKKDSRPISNKKNEIIVPSDGKINQLGNIYNNQLIQSKNHTFNLISLLGGNSSLANNFKDGIFILIYLSPSDYHRVHMPCDGNLSETLYIPGELFSVDESTLNKIQNVFSRNERLICIFDTKFGKMAQILIGSIIVGNIETIWNNKHINKKKKQVIQYSKYPKKNKNGSIFLKKGDEMGKFNLGSTVINIFEKDRIKLNQNLKNGKIVRMGELLGNGLIE